MDIGTFTLHLLGFLLPAPCIALCTTLAARWRAPSPLRPRRWLLQWLLSSAAGAAALFAGLWLGGQDGRIASYAALVLACATVSWALSLRRGLG